MTNKIKCDFWNLQLLSGNKPIDGNQKFPVKIHPIWRQIVLENLFRSEVKTSHGVQWLIKHSMRWSVLLVEMMVPMMRKFCKSNIKTSKCCQISWEYILLKRTRTTYWLKKLHEFINGLKKTAWNGVWFCIFQVHCRSLRFEVALEKAQNLRTFSAYSESTMNKDHVRTKFCPHWLNCIIIILVMFVSISYLYPWKYQTTILRAILVAATINNTRTFEFDLSTKPARLLVLYYQWPSPG